MKTCRMIVDQKAKVFAVLADGELQQYRKIEPTEIVGSIFRARVEKRIEALQAFQIAIGSAGEVQYALLRDSDCIWDLRAGEEVVVSIYKPGYDDKMPLATERYALSTDLMVLQVGMEGVKVSKKIEDADTARSLARYVENALRDLDFDSLAIQDCEDQKRIDPATGRETRFGLKVRTQAAYLAADVVQDAIRTDTEVLLERFVAVERERHFQPTPKLLVPTEPKWKTDAQAIWKRTKSGEQAQIVFESNEEEAVQWAKSQGRKAQYFEDYEIALDDQVRLSLDRWFGNRVEFGGAFLLVDILETLSVIDVNQGAFGLHWKRKEMARRVNLDAVQVIAKVVKLRSIRGILLIDFIRMDRADGKDVLKSLTHAFAKEGQNANVLGFTKAGLVEVLLPR